VIDTKLGQQIFLLESGITPSPTIDFSDDGKQIAYTDGEMTLFVRDLTTGDVTAKVNLVREPAVIRLLGQEALVSFQDGIEVVSLEKGVVVRSFKSERAHKHRIDPTRRSTIRMLADGRAELVSVTTGTGIQSWSEVADAAYSPNGRFIVIRKRTTAIVCDGATGESKATIPIVG
jgi:hypothetical protein